MERDEKAIKRCPRNGIYYLLRWNWDADEITLFNSESGEEIDTRVFTVNNGAPYCKVKNVLGDEAVLQIRDFIINGRSITR